MVSSLTVVISDHGESRKVAKILMLNDGGFSLAAPYHASHCGFLVKNVVDYSKREQYITPNEILEAYTASNPAKISMHVDGFVQFSSVNGNTIRSGRDRITDEPRGLGFRTYPLKTPVLTRPTVSLSVWGIEDFEKFGGNLYRSGILNFSEKDFYHRYPPEKCNGFEIRVFVYPKSMWPAVFREAESLYLEATYNFESVPTTFKFRVLPLRNIDSFIGISVSRIFFRFPVKSGFLINGPGSFRQVGAQLAETMFACYPGFVYPELPTDSLDYFPEQRKE